MDGSILEQKNIRNYLLSKERYEKEVSMNELKISVIVSAYNEGKLLSRCLESILQQTYTNLEIIVIDDGSTDDTSRILDQYAEKDSRIVAIHQKNAGLVAVREKGISIASGEYVGFVDGDDSIIPEMYERLLKNAVKYGADISHCGMLYCFEDGRTKPMHGTGKVQEMECHEGQIALLQGKLFEPSLCNKLFSAKILKDSCLDNTVVNNEDLLRNFVLFQRVEKSVLEDFCGYMYWRRNNSMSNNNRKRQAWSDIIRARALIVENCCLEVKSAAEACWLSSLIGAYNNLLVEDDLDSIGMRKWCREKLKMNQEYFSTLPKRERIFAYAIIGFPHTYALLQKFHQWIKQFQIKRAAAVIRKEKNEN